MQSKVFNIYKDSNRIVQNAYSMLIMNMQSGKPGKPVKTVACASCKPGEGKTSLLIGIAIAMASSGKKVLFADTDIRKPNEAKRLNHEFICGFSDFLEGMPGIDGIIYDTTIPNLSFVPCGRRCQDPSGLLGSARFDEFLSCVRDDYDFILLDTPALSSVADGLLIASKADATLILAEIGMTSLISLKRILNQLEKVNARVLGVVLNKVGKRDYKKHFESFNHFSDTKRFLNNKKVKKHKDSNVVTDLAEQAT